MFYGNNTYYTIFLSYFLNVFLIVIKNRTLSGDVSGWIKGSLKQAYVLTPSNVGVSSKHVQAFSYNSNSVWLSITVTVKSTCCPAVRGGAVT